MVAKKTVPKVSKKSGNAKNSKNVTPKKPKQLGKGIVVSKRTMAKPKPKSKTINKKKPIKRQSVPLRSIVLKPWAARIYFRRSDADQLLNAIQEVRAVGSQIELIRVSQRFYDHLASNPAESRRLDHARVRIQPARNLLGNNIAVLCLSNLDERNVTSANEVKELSTGNRGKSIEDQLSWVLGEFGEYLKGEYVIDVPKEVFETIMRSPRCTGDSFGIYHAGVSGKTDITFDNKEVCIGFGQNNLRTL